MCPKCFLRIAGNKKSTHFIYLISSNSVTIPHINYWDHVNSWKNFWKFWNGSLCRNKSGLSPKSMLQYVGRIALSKIEPRIHLKYLQTTLTIKTGGLVSGFILRYCLFFLPKVTILNIWGKLDVFMTDHASH